LKSGNWLNIKPINAIYLNPLEEIIVMKSKLFLAGILSTTAIASGVVLSSVTPAQSCMMSKYDYNQEKYAQPSWLRSPLSAAIALPGIALATALFVGGRAYEG
jgi:D-alanyl-lipoteichoic acid acyltransferase DltB (MBOAT superfamily)